MSIRFLPALLSPAVLLISMAAVDATAASYDGFRWFQVEVSIFSNEYPQYRDAELWSPDRLELRYPQGAREFRQLADIFRIEYFIERASGNLTPEQLQDPSPRPTTDPLLTPSPPVGPFPSEADADLRLLDLDRDPFLLLPPPYSNFQTTNTRLDRSPVNRLLFHGVWRQPVVQPDDASPLIVRGGRQFGQHHELEGTLTIRFNPNEDRVVIDTNLWLTEFSGAASGAEGWELPLPPGTLPADTNSDTLASIPDTAGISRVVHMQQSRAMRSTEFHYLDHPAMGVVITVLPYDLPPPGSPDSASTVEPPDTDL